jgi:hypothetical protein
MIPFNDGFKQMKSTHRDLGSMDGQSIADSITLSSPDVALTAYCNGTTTSMNEPSWHHTSHITTHIHPSVHDHTTTTT